jgi:hypothetical protein
MADSASGLTESFIRSCLNAFRAIATMPDQDALKATDEVLAQILEGARGTGRLALDVTSLPYNENDDLESWQLHRAEEDLERIDQSIERLEAMLGAPAGLQLWDAEGLKRSVDRCDEYMDKTIRERFAARIVELKRRAYNVASRVEAACFANEIRGSATQVIHSSSSVRSIIATVDRAAVALTNCGQLTPELAQTARAVKERAARYRCDKKLGEAEVAAAGGSDKRADKLRREAVAIIAQDWAQAFPGEPPPSIGP